MHHQCREAATGCTCTADRPRLLQGNLCGCHTHHMEGERERYGGGGGACPLGGSAVGAPGRGAPAAHGSAAGASIVCLPDHGLTLFLHSRHLERAVIGPPAT